MMRARLATPVGLLAAFVVAGPLSNSSTAQDDVPQHDFRALGARPEIHVCESPELLDLPGRLLPEQVEATKIAGNWSVENDVITFTNITADGVPTDQEPRQLATMFTGVLRIVAGPQYVFDRGQPQ